jgi:hypothetical protein
MDDDSRTKHFIIHFGFSHVSLIGKERPAGNKHWALHVAHLPPSMRNNHHHQQSSKHPHFNISMIIAHSYQEFC